MASFNLVEHFYGHQFEPPLAPTGYPRLFAKHRRPYRTADGYLCAMPYTDAHWKRFFTEGGMPQAAADPRFTSIAERTRHIDALYTLAAEVIATRTTDDWLQTFERLEVPASRMNRLEDLADDPHLKATGFFKTVQDPAMGTLRFPGAPVRIDRRQLPVRMAPRLGEHTHQVLRDAGIADLPTDEPLREGAPI
jgi:crotonobetainyl-CoA:carnitine CoA-transferase CaiB-like acyl-CoA transferase